MCLTTHNIYNNIYVLVFISSVSMCLCLSERERERERGPDHPFRQVWSGCRIPLSKFSDQNGGSYSMALSPQRQELIYASMRSPRRSLFVSLGWQTVLTSRNSVNGPDWAPRIGRYSFCTFFCDTINPCIAFVSVIYIYIHIYIYI
jgi:hypothetical protein